MQTMGSTSKDIKEKDKRLLEGVIQKKKKQQKGQMYLTKSKTSDELRRQKQKKWKKQHLQQIQ